MILLFLACSETLVIPETKEPRAAITNQKIVFRTESPLSRPEQFLTDWTDNIIEPLKHPEQVVGITNLIRSPCLEEWADDISLAESITKKKCSKSIDWLYEIDGSLNGNVDEVLFKFTMPGPYIEEVSQENTVWHRTDRKGLKQIVEKVSILPFNVQINEWNQKLQKFRTLTCDLKNETTDCTTGSWNDIPKDSWFFHQSSFTNSSPVWFINGYFLAGLQSNRAITNVSKLP